MSRFCIVQRTSDDPPDVFIDTLDGKRARVRLDLHRVHALRNWIGREIPWEWVFGLGKIPVSDDVAKNTEEEERKEVREMSEAYVYQPKTYACNEFIRQNRTGWWSMTMQDSCREMNRLAAERDLAIKERDAYLNAIVRPWTRDDGLSFWRVNLAWHDTTETKEQAIEMVNRIAGLNTNTEGSKP